MRMFLFPSHLVHIIYALRRSCVEKFGGVRGCLVKSLTTMHTVLATFNIASLQLLLLACKIWVMCTYITDYVDDAQWQEFSTSAKGQLLLTWNTFPLLIQSIRKVRNQWIYAFFYCVCVANADGGLPWRLFEPFQYGFPAVSCIKVV